MMPSSNMMTTTVDNDHHPCIAHSEDSSLRSVFTVSKRVLILRTWGPLGGTENGTWGAQIKILKCLILIR